MPLTRKRRIVKSSFQEADLGVVCMMLEIYISPYGAALQSFRLRDGLERGKRVFPNASKLG